jgi:hypothetical protein
LSGEISSFSSLRRNAGELDGIIPSWLELVRSPDGVTVTSDPASEEVVRWRRANAPHLAVYPQIVSTVSGRQMAAAIAVPAKRAAIIASVAAYVAKNDFQGAVVDFSSLPASSSRTKVILLAELADAIRTVRGKLILAISPGDDSMHLSAGARLVDYVILKTHDRTLLRDQAGAPAGQGWFEDQVWSSLAAIPRSKLIAAVGSYADEFSSVGTKRLLSVQGAWDIAGSKRASMTLEPLSLNESFLYHDNSGRPRRVWVLDAATAFNQAKSALAAGVAGIVLWKLGLEDPGVWNSLSRHKNPNEASLAAAGDVEPGLGSFDGVTGALLSVSPGRRGTRSSS